MSEDSILTLKNYGVAFGERIILSSVDLQIPERGIVVLLGPSGTGKSTLLRTLAGYNDASPSLRSWGEAWFAGAPLGTGEIPVLVAQKAKLMLSTVQENVIHELPERSSLDFSQQRDIAQRLLKAANLEQLSDKLAESVVNLSTGLQRHLSILRSVASNPKVLFVDEPTTGLNDSESEQILQYLVNEAKRRAIVVTVHNKKHANFLGGKTSILAGGWIHETQSTEKFFSQPETQAAKDYVHSGSCSVPSPDTPEEYLEAEALEIIKQRPVIPEAARQYKSDAFGPRNFLWLEKGVLAGTPRPGLVMSLDYDLEALQRVGISVLVSLTQVPLDQQLLQKYHIKGIAFPIVDMGVPSIDAAETLCAEIEQLIASGESIAFHCRAGMGRTGTMLALQLIWRGHSALDALETVRRIEPRWVQSETQVSFLDDFEKNLRHKLVK